MIRGAQVKYTRIAVNRKRRTSLFEELLGAGVILYDNLRHVDSNGRTWYFCLAWRPREGGDPNESLLRYCPSRPLAIDVAIAQKSWDGEIIPLGKPGRKRALIVLEQYVTYFLDLLCMAKYVTGAFTANTTFEGDTHNGLLKLHRREVIER